MPYFEVGHDDDDEWDVVPAASAGWDVAPAGRQSGAKANHSVPANAVERRVPYEPDRQAVVAYVKAKCKVDAQAGAECTGMLQRLMAKRAQIGKIAAVTTRMVIVTQMLSAPKSVKSLDEMDPSYVSPTWCASTAATAATAATRPALNVAPRTLAPKPEAKRPKLKVAGSLNPFWNVVAKISGETVNKLTAEMVSNLEASDDRLGDLAKIIGGYSSTELFVSKPFSAYMAGLLSQFSQEEVRTVHLKLVSEACSLALNLKKDVDAGAEQVLRAKHRAVNCVVMACFTGCVEVFDAVMAEGFFEPNEFASVLQKIFAEKPNYNAAIASKVHAHVEKNLHVYFPVEFDIATFSLLKLFSKRHIVAKKAGLWAIVV